MSRTEDKMRLLVADDSRTFRHLLLKLLTGAGHEVLVVHDGQAALDVLLGDNNVDVAILDWEMPRMSGPEVCRAVRAKKPEPYVHLILLTAKDDERAVVQALDAGADDYLTKPIRGEELKARVRAGRRTVELERALRSARDALQWESRHDALTGLFNRRAMEELLQMEWSRATREKRPFAVAFLDLDHFKHVNDTMGHRAGDLALVEAAGAMKAVLRPYDCVGRYGGEEFIVALPGCDLESAKTVAERVRAAVEGHQISFEDRTFSITTSIGLAATDRAGAFDVHGLVQAADALAYKAKQQGRNRVEAG